MPHESGDSGERFNICTRARLVTNWKSVIKASEHDLALVSLSDQSIIVTMNQVLLIGSAAAERRIVDTLTAYCNELQFEVD